MLAVPARRRRGRGSAVLAASVALALGVAFLVVLVAAPLSAYGAMVVDDAAQLAAAATAATLCCAATKGCSSPREARAWLFMAVATSGWAVGQAVWTWYELGLRNPAPFPSVADVGFLTFSVFAVAALLCMQPEARDASARWRDVLDGVGMAGALGIVAWGTSLESVYQSGSGDLLPLALALAYPVGDVVVVTVVLLTLSRAVAFPRGCLGLLAAGVSSLAVADTCYVYLTSVGSYESGDVADAGWVAGFLLVAAGAMHARLRRGDAGDSIAPPSSLGPALPYLPLLAALAVLTAAVLSGGGELTVETLGVLLLMVLVLARQALLLVENHRLVTALRRREQELAHQAYHDPLTGLANRAAFVERIEQRVARHHRDGTSMAVLFCDLDDFKDVNDTLGHAAGDVLLVEIAARLRVGVRANDVVARLGGDEFAVLLDHPHEDPGHVAARLVAGVAQPVDIAGRRVPTSVSIGAVVLPTPGGTQDPTGQRVTAGQLMATADRAMYHAKADGKGRHVMASADDLDEASADTAATVPLPRSSSSSRHRQPAPT